MSDDKIKSIKVGSPEEKDFFPAADKLERGRGSGNVFSLLSDRTKPVHVAVLCPPGAALTMLLNLMGEHNGMFVMLQNFPMQTSHLALAGKPQMELFPMLIFAIQQKEFEAWMGAKYDQAGCYQMADIMAGKMSNVPAVKG